MDVINDDLFRFRQAPLSGCRCSTSSKTKPTFWTRASFVSRLALSSSPGIFHHRASPKPNNVLQVLDETQG